MPWDDWFAAPQQFYGPTNEELGYVPPPQPNFFENIYNQFAQSPHLQQAGNYFQSAVAPDEEDPNSAWQAIQNMALGGFRGMQEVGKAGGEALGILPVIQASEDIISTPYRQLGYLAEMARSGRAPEMKPGASLFETITGSGLQNVPQAGQIAREGLQGLGSLALGASLPEASTIALGNANYGDIDPAVESRLREVNPLSFGFQDIVEPAIDVGLQLGSDPAGPGMAMASGNPLLARILGGVNLPSDVMDVVDTSGQAIDVGRKSGFTSPEGIRALSTFLGTAGLTGADIAPEILGTPLDVGPVMAPITGSEAGAAINPFDVPIELQNQVQENIIDNLRTETIPESELIPVDPLQSVQESSKNALEQKIGALEQLGYGQETIGGLNIEDVNNIISAGTERSSFESDPIKRIMKDYNVDRQFAEEIYYKENPDAVPERLVDVPPPNIVYHGTPYDFNEFDLSKIGTGEGAQARGYGFYFGENPNVAKAYVNPVQGYEAPGDYAGRMVRHYGSREEAIKQLEMLSEREPTYKFDERAIEDAKEALQLVREGKYSTKTPQILAAQIPSPEHFLDLDKPISEQRDKVQASMKDIPSELIDKLQGVLDNPNATGTDLYEAMVDVSESVPDIRAARRMGKAGIKGLKYLDQKSRKQAFDYATQRLVKGDEAMQLELSQAKEDLEALNDPKYWRDFLGWTENQKNDRVGDLKEQIEYIESGSKERGTSNVVVFNPKDIKILEKTQELAQDKLTEFVSSVKEKYGKSWRKDLTPTETEKFDTLKMEAVQDPRKAIRKNQELVKASEQNLRESIISEEAKPEQEISKIESDQERIDKIKLMQAQKQAAALPVRQITSPLVTKPVNALPISAQQQQNIPNVPPIASIPPVRPPTPPSPPTQRARPRSYRTLSALERAFLSPERNVSKADIATGQLMKTYKQSHEKMASHFIQQYRTTKQSISNKAFNEKVIPFLDGQQVTLTPQERIVADDVRNILDQIARLGERQSVLIGYRGNYFPRMYKDKFEWQVHPRAMGRNAPFGSLERARLANKMNFRRDSQVMEEYIDAATRRIAESRYLGKELGKVLPRNIVGDPDTAGYVSRNILRETGRIESTPAQRIGAKIRYGAALTDLTRAAIYQPLQFIHTASVVGFRRATAAAFKTVFNFKKSELGAIRAIYPNISHELAGSFAGRGPKFMKGYMHGIPTLDKAMRVHADVAGKMLLTAAQNGNRFAIDALAKLGFNNPHRATPNEVGSVVSDKTNFRTGSWNIPGWASHPFGKMIFQYFSFAYASTKFVSDMIRHPFKNKGQILKFALLGLPAAEGVLDIRAMIDAAIPGDDEDDEYWKRVLEAVAGDPEFDDKILLDKLKALGRTKRIPWSSPGWRAIQNLALLGGTGIFQNILEKVTSDDPGEWYLGPAISQISDFGKAAGRDISKGIRKGEWDYKNIARESLRNVPIPGVSGYKLAGKVYPPEGNRSTFPRF